MPEEWAARARTLAGRIADAVKPAKTVSLNVKNLSSLSAGEVDAIRKTLEGELASRGVRIAATGVDVKVTLSENFERFLWIAEIQRGHESTVLMVSSEGKAAAAGVVVTHSVVLHRDLVWQQLKPMMDFLISDISADGRPLMFVLETSRIVSYRKEKGSWIPAETFSIPVSEHRPRDLRGLIDVSADLFSFQLSDGSCSGVARVSLELTCDKGRGGAWPIFAGGQERGSMNMVENRNYFSGDLAIYGDVEVEGPPFFSVAVMKRMNGGDWILAELDGKSRKYQESSTAAATYAGWGDNVVSVAQGCGDDWQILASAAGDWTEPDRLRSYDVSGDAPPRPDSEPLEFPGPILALWPSLNGSTARVVSKNLQTGAYEASIVSVACGN